MLVSESARLVDRGLWLVVWVLCGLIAGCGPQAYEGRTATVSGKVTLNEVALSAGNVLFMMEDGHAASAAISTDGTFATNCRPGNYKVAVTPPELIDPLAGGGAAGRVAIPSRYQDLGSSGLTAELKEGGNEFNIKLAK